MYQPLVPCSECRRHVRAVEALCPFCRAPREVAAIDATPLLRMSRAAAMAVAASLVVACQSEPLATPIAKDPVAVKPSATPAPSTSQGGGLVDDPGAAVAEYGAPAPPPPKPSPIAVPAYGAPPPVPPPPLPKP